MSGRKIGVAVLGLGRMGSIHVQNLMASGRASVKWLMRRDVPAAAAFASRMDLKARCVTPADLGRILEDTSVEGVIISSYTSEHEAQIKACLEAGKTVFSEKPITAEIASTTECYDLAEKSNRPLMCAFHRRFDPSFRSVHENIRQQTSGRLRLLRVTSHDLSAPPIEYVKASGGIFTDSTIHDLDMALWVTGSPAKRISVSGNAFRKDIGEAGDLDLVVVTIEHQNGAISVIDNGRRCAHGYDQRLEALCDEGSYVVTNRPTHQVQVHREGASLTPDMDQVFDTRYREAYNNEILHFLNVMAGTEEPVVTREDVLGAMTLAEAAKASVESGKAVLL